MSYIRNSNPEKLYVYRDVGGYISFIIPNKPFLTISLRDWRRLCYRYMDCDYFDFKGKRLQVEHDVKRGNNFKVRFSILNNGIWYHSYLYEVTYHYMMRNAIVRFK